MTKSDDLACGKCGKNVPEDTAICCEGLCNKWFDLQCAKLSRDDYERINKLGKRVKWYCTVCTKNVSDLLKVKLVHNKEDWPSILNVVLASVQENSEVTLDLANRLQDMERKDNETNKTLDTLVRELSYIRGSMDKKKGMEVNSRPKHDSRLTYTGSESGPGSTVVPPGPRGETDLEHEPTLQVDKNFIQSTECGNYTEEQKENYDEEFPLLPTTDKHEWEKVKRRTRHNRLRRESNHKENQENHKFKKFPDLEQGRESRPRPKQVQYRKDTAIIGKKKTVSGLTVAEKNSWLFISRLGAEVSIESVNDFVSGLCEGKKVKCEELKTRYNTYKSFKVGCPIHYLDKLLDGEVWPEGILVTKFIPQKKHFGHKGNGNDGPRVGNRSGQDDGGEKNCH